MSRRHRHYSFPYVRVSAVVGAAVTAVLLAGCGAEDEVRTTPVASLVGRSVAQVEGALPSEASMVSYDLSKPVTGAESKHSLSDDTYRTEWIVVAACANTKRVEDDTRLAVGVLNADDYSGNVERKAKKHAFDRYLSECK
ncbi:hypothetical protein [Streptomyces sp. NPDC046939]|uniref:hypothetical protein n=1 Tax=Streptomyces sp. NPDC046939 TaxID=3155376 RepID=UPI0033EB273B